MKTLVLIFLTAFVTSGMNAQNNMEAASKGDNGKDVMFINEAASAGLMEVELGKLAQQKATSQAVKDFGKMMERDHSDANRKLSMVTQKLGLASPANMMGKHKDEVSDLKEKDAANFDKAYIDLMVKDHKDDVDKFENALEDVQNSELKQWISSTLQVMKQHQAKAESLQEQLKDK